MDIGFGVIILVAVIVGLAVGFSRQFSRPLCGLIAIFGAIALTTIIFKLISPLGFYTTLEQKATGLFKAEFYTQEASDPESLAAILSTGYLRILSGSAEGLWGKMVSNGVATVGGYFGKLMVAIITKFLLWLACYLIIKYLLFGIKYLMTKISRVVVFKSMDKIFGLIWSIAITYIIVVGIVLSVGEMVLAKFFPNIGNILADIISRTTILRFLHNTNVIGSFMSSILNWPLLPNL